MRFRYTAVGCLVYSPEGQFSTRYDQPRGLLDVDDVQDRKSGSLIRHSGHRLEPSGSRAKLSAVLRDSLSFYKTAHYHAFETPRRRWVTALAFFYNTAHYLVFETPRRRWVTALAFFSNTAHYLVLDTRRNRYWA